MYVCLYGTNPGTRWNCFSSRCCGVGYGSHPIAIGVPNVFVFKIRHNSSRGHRFRTSLFLNILEPLPPTGIKCRWQLLLLMFTLPGQEDSPRVHERSLQTEKNKKRCKSPGLAGSGGVIGGDWIGLQLQLQSRLRFLIVLSLYFSLPVNWQQKNFACVFFCSFCG